MFLIYKGIVEIFPFSVEDLELYGAHMVIRVVEFSSEGTKLERFLPKNQHNQRKSLNSENWCNGGCHLSKSALFDFQNQFFMSKIIGIFLNFKQLTSANDKYKNIGLNFSLTKEID